VRSTHFILTLSNVSRRSFPWLLFLKENNLQGWGEQNKTPDSSRHADLDFPALINFSYKQGFSLDLLYCTFPLRFLLSYNHRSIEITHSLFVSQVEALLNDYLCLQPQEGLCDDDDGGYGKDLMVSDDDNYQPEQKAQGEFLRLKAISVLLLASHREFLGEAFVYAWFLFATGKNQFQTCCV